MTGVDTRAAAFIHPSAHLYGHVEVGEGSSVWINAAVRAEAAHVKIGRFTNIQDFVMIHPDPGRPVEIGDYCSITHHATIHGSVIGNHVLVGINATVYSSRIGDNSIVGQHAYVKDGTDVPANSIVVGAPAKIIRTANNWIANRMNALFYHRNALAYAKGDHRAWEGPQFDAWLREMLAQVTEEYQAMEQAA
ncbi:MAG: gamma carbonic anhydrase family protein [Sphingomonadaceae bacterium]